MQSPLARIPDRFSWHGVKLALGEDRVTAIPETARNLLIRRTANYRLVVPVAETDVSFGTHSGLKSDIAGGPVVPNATLRAIST